MRQKKSRYWLSLDDAHLTDDEYDAMNQVADALDISDAATVQVTTLDEHLQPSTTVMAVRRVDETLALVIRADRSVCIATDDIQALRWRDTPS